MPAETYHLPVFPREISDLASGRKRIVDATIGGGGHATLFQEQGAAVLGIDRDPEALHAARARLSPDGLTLLQAGFASAEALAAIQPDALSPREALDALYRLKELQGKPS